MNVVQSSQRDQLYSTNPVLVPRAKEESLIQYYLIIKTN